MELTQQPCRLCLSSSDQSVNIFSNVYDLKIATILRQHFWFDEIRMDDPYSKFLCNTCWHSVKEFHIFYRRIQEVHFKNNEICSPQSPEKVNVEDALSYFYPNDSSDAIEVKTEDAISQSVENIKQEILDCEPITELTVDISPNLVLKSVRKTKTKKVKVKPKPTKEIKLKKITKPIKTYEEKLQQLDTQMAEDEKIRTFFKIECQICVEQKGSSQIHSTFRELTEHFRILHSGKRSYLVCCGKRYLNRAAVLEHIRWHLNPQEFKCSLCSRCFAKSYHLKRHNLVIHSSAEERVFKCDTCGKGFPFKSDLLQHLLTRHVSAENKAHKCDDCEYVTSVRGALKQHILAMHQKINAFLCDFCAKGFRNKYLCRDHILKQHLQTDKQPKMQCDVCSAWLMNARTLRKHKFMMHADTPQVCDLCHKVSRNQNALQAHKRLVHFRQRLHKCNFCNKSFKTGLVLREHVARHTGTALYNCPYCTKTFNCSGNKCKHIKRIHPEEWDRTRPKIEHKLAELSQASMT